MGALLEDRKIRQDDFDASQAAAARKLDEMAARLKKAEDTLQHTTHDLIIGAYKATCTTGLDFGPLLDDEQLFKCISVDDAGT